MEAASDGLLVGRTPAVDGPSPGFIELDSAPALQPDARHARQDKFCVRGDYPSYYPHGIMFRKGKSQLTAVWPESGRVG
jgi:hypothetical protein